MTRKQILIGLFFVVIGLFATFNLWNPKLVIINMLVHSYGNANMRFYYTTADHPKFDKKQSISYQVQMGIGAHDKIKNIKIELPVSKLTGVKFVVEKMGGGIELSDVIIKGKKKNDVVDLKKIISPVSLNENGKIFLSKEIQDTEILVPLQEPCLAKRKVDPYLLLSLFFGLLGILFLITELKHPTPVKQNMLYNIEFYRTWATFCVMLCHLLCTAVVLGANPGRVVNFFFLISGFFIAKTFNPEKLTIDFLKVKIIRWCPLLLFGGFIARPNLSCLKEVFFLQNTGLLPDPLRNSPAWYMGVLFWSSLLMFYIQKAFRREQANLIIGVVSFFSLVVYIRTGTYGFWEMVGGYIPKGLLLGLGVMGIGYFLYQISSSQVKFVEKANKKISIFEFILLIYLMLTVYIPIPFMDEMIFSCILQALLIFLFIGKKGLVSRFLDKPIWAHISRYSLSMYLTHWGICSGVAARLFTRYNGWVCGNKILFVVFFIVLSSLVAIFAHHAVEEPAARALTKFFYGDKK